MKPKIPKSVVFKQHGRGKFLNSFKLMGFTMVRYQCGDLVLVFPLNELNKIKRGGQS